MKKNPTFLVLIFLLFHFNVTSQQYLNDLEKYNLKGDIELLFYDSYYPKEFEEIKKDYSTDSNNYYISFDENGNINYYGLYETNEESNKKSILTKVNVNHDENQFITLKDKNGNIIESSLLINKGYFKNLPKSKKIYEYYHSANGFKKPMRIIEYVCSLDTLDIGYQIINTNSNNFSDAKHVTYSFNKLNEKIFNFEGRITKEYYYQNILLGGTGYDDLSEDIIEYEYDELENLILKKTYTQKWFKFKNIFRYEYTYDTYNNWTLKWVYDESLAHNTVDKTIRRSIVYRKN
jgi:hypothetical protein